MEKQLFDRVVASFKVNVNCAAGKTILASADFAAESSYPTTCTSTACRFTVAQSFSIELLRHESESKADGKVFSSVCASTSVRLVILEILGSF